MSIKLNSDFPEFEFRLVGQPGREGPAPAWPKPLQKPRVWGWRLEAVSGPGGWRPYQALTHLLYYLLFYYIYYWIYWILLKPRNFTRWAPRTPFIIYYIYYVHHPLLHLLLESPESTQKKLMGGACRMLHPRIPESPDPASPTIMHPGVTRIPGSQDPGSHDPRSQIPGPQIPDPISHPTYTIRCQDC